MGPPLLPSSTSRRTPPGAAGAAAASRSRAAAPDPKNSGTVRHASSQNAVTITSAATPAEKRSLRVPRAWPTAAKFMPPPM
ncbi:MAG: hypothetical protein R2708_09180 [Vicinamibacterales bacterium]